MRCSISVINGYDVVLRTTYPWRHNPSHYGTQYIPSQQKVQHPDLMVYISTNHVEVLCLLVLTFYVS